MIFLKIINGKRRTHLLCKNCYYILMIGHNSAALGGLDETFTDSW